MTAFIVSGALSFALYQLLLFTKWPPAGNQIDLSWLKLQLTDSGADRARALVRAAIVAGVLLLLLLAHHLGTRFDLIAQNQTNFICGCVFGPLFAIWTNAVVLHHADEALSRGQVLAAVGLVLLFFLGATGDETARLLKSYARNVNSLKLGEAEVSFKDANSGNRLSSTAIPGSSETFVPGGSQGLAYLASLDQTIKRDNDYIGKAFSDSQKSTVAPGSLQKKPDQDLESSRVFAADFIAPPFSCLLNWSQQTGDARSAEKYLTSYADAFREFEAFNALAVSSANAPPWTSDRLREIASDFVRDELAMTRDIALSTTTESFTSDCRAEPYVKWLDELCPPGMKNAVGGEPENLQFARCFSHELSDTDDQYATQKVSLINLLVDEIRKVNDFAPPASLTTPNAVGAPPADEGGIERLPYFAISRASIMSQLGQHEAAAAILDDWLGIDSKKADGGLHWLSLRVRSFLAIFVEEWLDDKGATAAAVILSEHLANLRTTVDGFKAFLHRADFFVDLEKRCLQSCELMFQRPGACKSDLQGEELTLWKNIFSSYITLEYTYIHRALEHPRYADDYAEIVNDEARAIVNFDLSCGADSPSKESVYAQSLLGFAENALHYDQFCAERDGRDERVARLSKAERAARFGLEIIESEAEQDQDRNHKPYLERIAPSISVQVKEKLTAKLAEIHQAIKDLSL